MDKRIVAALCACAAFGATGATCTPTPTSDSNIPTLHMLAWRDNGSGGQGQQDDYQPGSTLTVSRGFLGANKADIRIYGEEKPGVQRLTVTLSAVGRCSTHVNSKGQYFTSPSALTASAPPIVENSPSGQVIEHLAASLDAVLAGEHSCGTHRYNGMEQAEEFFLDTGTWTANAVAENCCGGNGTGTFTIKVT